MFDKKQLLKTAEDVRANGVTTQASKELMKKASLARIATLIAVINK